MKTTEPWFMEWVIVSRGGWKLKKNAPEDVKKAFQEYINLVNSGTIISEVDDGR